MKVTNVLKNVGVGVLVTMLVGCASVGSVANQIVNNKDKSGIIYGASFVTSTSAAEVCDATNNKDSRCANANDYVVVSCVLLLLKCYCELKMTDIILSKKKGRPSQGLTKTVAERQRLARSAAHKELLVGDVKNISTSNLVSSLPFCLSRNLDTYALDICREIERVTVTF